MINSGVYRIRNNVNGKVYIGSTINFKRRKVDHFKELRGNKHPNPKLQKAYNKYGEENIVFEIVEYVAPEKLLEREQYYIDSLNAVNEGYNIAPIAGNRLGVKCSEETKIKLKKLQTGRRHTEETKQKLREYHQAHPQVGSKNGMYGRKHTEETIEKMRKAQKGRNLGRFKTEETRKKISNNSTLKRKVRCIEKDIIFNSITEASKYFNSNSNHITECCKGKLNTSLGYHWEYVDEGDQLIIGEE